MAITGGSVDVGWWIVDGIPGRRSPEVCVVARSAIFRGSIAERCIVALRKQGRPMSLWDLADAVGLEHTPNSHGNIAIALRRRPEVFIRVRLGVYGLVAWRTE